MWKRTVPLLFGSAKGADAIAAMYESAIMACWLSGSGVV